MMRIVVVGHRTWFENHYPEGWERDCNVLCLDVDESDYGWLNIAHNFRPDISLFYRPELYPVEFIKRVPGLRIAFLSEPVPETVDGKLHFSDETRLRLAVYQRIRWDAYHHRVFYDPGKASSIGILGFPIDEFRALPINTDWFKPGPRHRKTWDVTFVGKATPYRIAKLDFLRTAPFKFLWIAHGASGRELSAIFRRSKIVLNVHADGHGAMEPRIYLAAACGALVATEPLSSRPSFFADKIVEFDHLDTPLLARLLERSSKGSVDKVDLQSIGVRKFINDCAMRFGIR